MKRKAVTSFLFPVFLAVATQASAWSASLVELPINPALKKLSQQCDSVAQEGYFLDYVACISVTKYAIPAGMSLEQLKALLLDSNQADALVASQDPAVEAAAAMDSRLKSYRSWNVVSEFVGNTGPYDSESEMTRIRSQFKTYRDATAKTVAIMKGMARGTGNHTFIDADTYWAPSVNASAVWIINPAKKTIYKFALGDLDG